MCHFLIEVSTEKLVPHDSSKDFRTVFVSNLSYDVDEEQIKSFFCKVSIVYLKLSGMFVPIGVKTSEQR